MDSDCIYAVCEPRQRNNWDRLGYGILIGGTWGFCGVVIYVCLGQTPPPWGWWFAAGSAVLAAAMTGAWFIKPRGRITVDERSRSLLIEGMPISRGLKLWSRGETAIIPFSDIRGSTLVPSRHGPPALWIRTARGGICVPGEWTGFAELCEAMSRLQEAPLRRTGLWIRFSVLVLLAALGICWLILLLFNWP